MIDHPSNSMREIADSLQENYEQIFQKHALDRIAAYEKGWTEFESKNPNWKAYVDLQLSKLRTLRIHVPNISREAASFHREVDQAHYNDALDELDIHLARRELNFRKILVGALIENHLLARLERARGPVQDFESALHYGHISRSARSIGQLAGTDGYLTHPPEVEPVHRWSSEIANNLARSMKDSFRLTRRKILDQLVRFYFRYVMDFVRRNLLRVLISVGLFGLAVGFIIEKGNFSVWGLGGVLVILSAVGTWVFERVFKRHWLEIHRRAVRSAATQLYMSFLYFGPERAFLDAMHDLSNEKLRRELTAKMPSDSTGEPETSLKSEQ